MRRPSVRQIKALQFMSQGLSKRQAMIRAGYRVSTANQASRATATTSMLNLIETTQSALIDAGLTPKFMAMKLKQMMEAKKSDPDDYPTQIKGLDNWRKIMDYEGEEKVMAKRRISIEEFIFGKDSNGNSNSEFN